MGVVSIGEMTITLFRLYSWFPVHSEDDAQSFNSLLGCHSDSHVCWFSMCVRVRSRACVCAPNHYAVNRDISCVEVFYVHSKFVMGLVAQAMWWQERQGEMLSKKVS